MRNSSSIRKGTVCWGIRDAIVGSYEQITPARCVDVQVRLRRVAGIAHFAQELPRDDLVSDVDSDRAGLHVGEMHAVTVAEDDDVIPARSIFAVRIQRPPVGPRVLGCDHFTRTRCDDVRAEGGVPFKILRKKARSAEPEGVQLADIQRIVSMLVDRGVGAAGR